MIHSALLTGSTPTVTHPNHWISFLGTLHIDEGVWVVHDDGHFSFDCYSWGSTRHVEEGEVNFEDYKRAGELSSTAPTTCCRRWGLSDDAFLDKRLVSALAVEQSEEWVTDRRYLDMQELEECRREQQRQAEEAAFTER